MSGHKTIADQFLVTAFTRRVHVRHLTSSGWADGFTAIDGTTVNVWRYFPLCGTGDADSRYRFALPSDAHLPICKRCSARLAEYLENSTPEFGMALNEAATAIRNLIAANWGEK